MYEITAPADITFLTLYRWKAVPMEMRIAKKSRFRIDKLEERVAPAAFASALHVRVCHWARSITNRTSVVLSDSRDRFCRRRCQRLGGGWHHSPVGALLGRRVGAPLRIPGLRGLEAMRRMSGSCRGAPSNHVVAAGERVTRIS